MGDRLNLPGIRVDGRELKTQNEVWIQTGNGHGSTNNKIRRFTNVNTNVGNMTLIQSAADGDSVTINESGVYCINYSDGDPSTSAVPGISLNSSQLTTAAGSITRTDLIGFASTPSGGGQIVYASATVFLKPGDIVRPHTTGLNSDSSAQVMFRVTKVS